MQPYSIVEKPEDSQTGNAVSFTFYGLVSVLINNGAKFGRVFVKSNEIPAVRSGWSHEWEQLNATIILKIKKDQKYKVVCDELGNRYVEITDIM